MRSAVAILEPWVCLLPYAPCRLFASTSPVVASWFDVESVTMPRWTPEGDGSTLRPPGVRAVAPWTSCTRGIVCVGVLQDPVGRETAPNEGSS